MAGRFRLLLCLTSSFPLHRLLSSITGHPSTVPYRSSVAPTTPHISDDCCAINHGSFRASVSQSMHVVKSPICLARLAFMSDKSHTYPTLYLASDLFLAPCFLASDRAFASNIGSSTSVPVVATLCPLRPVPPLSAHPHRRSFPSGRQSPSSPRPANRPASVSTSPLRLLLMATMKMDRSSNSTMVMGENLSFSPSSRALRDWRGGMRGKGACKCHRRLEREQGMAV